MERECKNPACPVCVKTERVVHKQRPKCIDQEPSNNVCKIQVICGKCGSSSGHTSENCPRYPKDYFRAYGGDRDHDIQKNISTSQRNRIIQNVSNQLNLPLPQQRKN